MQRAHLPAPEVVASRPSQKVGAGSADLSREDRALEGHSGNQAALRRLSPAARRIQPRLEIGAVNDPLEAEADRAADQVTRMPSPVLAASRVGGRLQRKCTACEEEEKLQRKADSARDIESDVSPVVQQTLDSPGQPLNPETRAYFEPRFGSDFKNVRIHTDAAAAQSAQSVRALAYTVGNHVVFAKGQYAPATDAGRRLMAHELTHVMQQNPASPAPEQSEDIGNPGDESALEPGQITLQSAPVLRADPDPDPNAPNPGGGGKPDPDAQCMGCTPLNKVTKMDGTTKYVIGVCKDTFDQMNGGGGTVDLGPGCLPQASNTTSNINFISASAGGVQAWDTDAHLADCTTPAPAPNATTPWEIGFIQTLVTSTRGAVYDNNNFILVTNSNKRDANTDKNPPWIDAAGGISAPQIYPTTPHIRDSPFQTFPITHPDTGGKDFLRSACMNETYNIWLILHRANTTATAASVDFLYNWTVKLTQRFILQGQTAHPCNKSQWLAAGHQVISSKGPGKGSGTPLFSGPIANGSQTTDTKTKNNPCASSPQPSGNSPGGKNPQQGDSQPGDSPGNTDQGQQ